MLSKHSIVLHIDHTTYQATYWEAGSGQPLVFLHGFMGRSECWESLITHLQPYYRCICLDMLGFGESSKPMIRYDIALLVRFVRAFTTALAIEPCVLIGHSLGGWVASAYALAHPAAVSGLVLAAPAGIRDDSFCGRYDHLRPLLWQTPVVDAALWLMQPLAKVSGNQKGLAQIRWMRRELNGQPAPRSFLLDRMRPEDAIDTVEKEIHQLRVPTLVITGDQDETIPLWHSQTYANEIPQAQLALIPDADHSLPQRYAAEMAEILLPFLHQTLSAERRHSPAANSLSILTDCAQQSDATKG